MASSSSYYQRVTARIPATMAAHPGWTKTQARQFLRGHGFTPEHGHVKHVAPGGGPTTFETARGADAVRVLEGLAHNNPKQRVTVTVTYKDGRQYTYFRNPGHGKGGGFSVEGLVKAMHDQQTGKQKRFVRGLLDAQSKTKYRVRRADSVARVQVQIQG